MTAVPGVILDGSATLKDVPLFDALTLSLAPGSWTCLLGGSGVGKSTILRLIAGLHTEATFTGKISATDQSALSQSVTYMAQEDLLLPWATVEQNITLGARLRAEPMDTDRRADIIQRIGLSDHAAKKPDALSGGQRQRAALARTLMENKPIVLLDEPFSALDAKTRADMQDLAVEHLSGKTVLIVTHDPAEAARLGESILLMTPQGLSDFKTPVASVPRPVDDIETLECQAALLRSLRGLAP